MVDTNIENLLEAVRQMEELSDDVVFVGGATISCYITDEAMPGIRATKDVDCIVGVENRTKYYSFIDRLKEKGFLEDTTEGSPICRYRKDGVLLDVMPTKENILGFTNDWYTSGLRNPIQITKEDCSFKVLNIGFAIATKLAAFRSRGKSDHYMSHDLEDIIAIFDGNHDIVKLLKDCHGDPKLRSFFKQELSELLQNPEFLASIEGHINDRNFASERSQIVINRLNEILINLEK